MLAFEKVILDWNHSLKGIINNIGDNIKALNNANVPIAPATSPKSITLDW